MFFPTETQLTKDRTIVHIICKGKYGLQLQERNATTTTYILLILYSYQRGNANYKQSTK